MESSLKGKRILLIDRQDAWRAWSGRGLRGAGAMVEERDNYGYPPSGGKYKGLEPPFDLVILGCPGIRKAEHELINRILEHRDHLLVLSTSLPPVIMRTVFLAGADDVTDKPYDPAKLVNVVSEALDAIKPRDGYQAAAQEVPW